MRLILLALLTLVADVPAAASPWLRAEGPTFIVYSRGSEAELRVTLEQLEKFDGLLRLLTGITPASDLPRLPVYVAKPRELKIFGMDPAYVVGFYSASPGAVFAVLAEQSGTSAPEKLSTLFHEYTHHFMFQHSRGVYPPWYIEGFAEYLSTARFKPGVTEYGDGDPGRGFQLMNRGWTNMAKILSFDPNDRNFDPYAFYAQSWLAVHYLTRDPERAKGLRTYLRLLNEGQKPEPAFTQAFGLSYATFNGQLRSYMMTRQLTLSRLTGVKPVPPSEMRVTPLPASRDTLLLLAGALAATTFSPPRPFSPEPGASQPLIAAGKRADAEQKKTRAKLLASVREATGKLPGDAYARAVLAEAEVKLGDRAAGIALLDAGLAAAPVDAQLLYLRAATAIDEARAGRGDRAAQMKQARSWLARAARAQPDDYRILAAHAATFAPVDVVGNEVDVLMRAATLAPQVSSVQAHAALVLAARGRREEARLLLLPIANNPHGGAQVRAAAALMTAIAAGKPPADLPPELVD